MRSSHSKHCSNAFVGVYACGILSPIDSNIGYPIDLKTYHINGCIEDYGVKTPTHLKTFINKWIHMLF